MPPIESSLMTPAARLSAAIELIDTIEAQRVPAAKALKDWGTSHRFAGSGDRAAIAGLVWDVLRRRASSAWVMEDDSRARAAARHAQARARPRCRDDRAFCDGGRFAPAPLTEAERNALASRTHRRRAAAGRRRLSGLARSLSRRRVRRGPRRRGDGDGEPGAARPARQHAEGEAARRC